MNIKVHSLSSLLLGGMATPSPNLGTKMLMYAVNSLEVELYETMASQQSNAFNI